MTWPVRILILVTVTAVAVLILTYHGGAAAGGIPA